LEKIQNNCLLCIKLALAELYYVQFRCPWWDELRSISLRL